MLLQPINHHHHQMRLIPYTPTNIHLELEMFNGNSVLFLKHSLKVSLNKTYLKSSSDEALIINQSVCRTIYIKLLCLSP